MSRSYTVVAPPRKPLSGAGAVLHVENAETQGVSFGKYLLSGYFRVDLSISVPFFFHYCSMFTITGSRYIGRNNTDHIHLLRSSYFGNKRRGRQFGAKKNDNSMAGIFV